MAMRTLIAEDEEGIVASLAHKPFSAKDLVAREAAR